MLLRNQQGTLIKINRKDFVNDEEYYAAIYKVVSGKDIINKKPYIVTDLITKATKRLK